MGDGVVLVVAGLFRTLAVLYDIITFIPYFIFFNPRDKIKKSNRIKACSVSGNPEGPWQSVEVPGKLTTTLFPECATLDDLFLRAVNLYAQQPCLGTRELLREEDEKQPNGRVFKKVVLGEYKWLTYEAVFHRASVFGSGVLALGQKPRANLVIFAATRAEWMIVAQACFKYNFPLVTLYATLGQDAIIHGINETEVTHVITSQDQLSKFEGALDKMPGVTHLIVITNEGQPKPYLKKKPPNVELWTMAEVELEGSRPENLRTPVTKPTRKDIAVIMYTSGSTGLPKGVVMLHENLMSGMSGQCERIPLLGKVTDTYVGYLPLAHVLELTAELSCVAHGVCIGYSSPLTLTDQSSKIKKGSQGDVSVLKPTLVAAVPVIMDRLYKGVWDKVNSGSSFGRALFNFAYNYKQNSLKKGYDTPLLNKVVFKKVGLVLGGSVRLMLCGGAPLSGTTQRFMNICFCCPVAQGYGLTETCGAGTVAEATDLSLGRVGAPLICSEIRLRDWQEGGYLSTDKPYPRGEVLIGGGNIAAGYYKMEDLTKEDFITINNTRYFCTGDIGQFEEDGNLAIIDRKKDLVKLQIGEYVSLGKVETVLKMSPLVEQVCVCARSEEHNTVGLIVPNQKNLESLAKKLNGDFGTDPDFHKMCKNPALIQAVTESLTQHALKSKLEKFEIPLKFALCPEPWMPDSGLVTDAFKLKRKNIDIHFKAEIDSMYAQ